MARPKDKTVFLSSAFLEKCEREKQKLRRSLADQLKEDMIRLFDDSSHSDVKFIVQDREVKAHKMILKARQREFYNAYVGDKDCVRIDVVTFDTFCNFLRQVYAEDKLSIGGSVVLETLMKNKIVKCTSPRPAKDNVKDNNQNFTVIIGKLGSPPRINNDIIFESYSRGEEAPLINGSTNGSVNGNVAREPVTPTSKEPEFSDTSPVSDAAVTPVTPPVHTFPAGIGKPCSALGCGLLQAYLGGEGTDMTVQVSNTTFRCHRSILAARSSYFTAMLRGCWVESSANVIQLEGVSAEAMQQALFFMYGGVSDIGGAISLLDLITLADMYGVQGLSQVVAFLIKKENCHFFHKPCQGCTAGVPEILPICHTFLHEEIFTKAVRWTGKHFAKVWPTKAFATLPDVIKLDCAKAATADMDKEGVLDIIMDCDKLLGSLPRVNWSSPIATMTENLVEKCLEFLKANFVEVLQSKRFMDLGKSMAWSMSFLEDKFGESVATLSPEKACRLYMTVCQLKDLSEDTVNCQWTEDFKAMIVFLHNSCENFMIQHMNHVFHTADWDLLPRKAQLRLKEEMGKKFDVIAAVYVNMDKNDVRLRAPPPRLTSQNRDKQTGGKPATKPSSNRRSTGGKDQHKPPAASKGQRSRLPAEGQGQKERRSRLPAEGKGQKEQRSRASGVSLNESKVLSNKSTTKSFSNVMNNSRILDRSVSHQERSLSRSKSSSMSSVQSQERSFKSRSSSSASSSDASATGKTRNVEYARNRRSVSGLNLTVVQDTKQGRDKGQGQSSEVRNRRWSSLPVMTSTSRTNRSQSKSPIIFSNSRIPVFANSPKKEKSAENIFESVNTFRREVTTPPMDMAEVLQKVEGTYVSSHTFDLENYLPILKVVFVTPDEPGE